ncbi:MAG: hypothetical protein H7145_09040 [Akkermansiaceae bacterium]|nr:hypothetical protein [Armatimonadota bacterium]
MSTKFPFPSLMTKRAGRALFSSTETWTLLAIALVLFYRFPHRLLTPQLWAEDGTIFLMGQRELGVTSLWVPYAGYLHLILRILALAMGTVAPLLLIPATYNIVTFLGTLLVGLFILRCRIELPYKPLWAFTLVFIPHPYEVYLTLTNLQWIFAAVLPLFLMQSPAPTRMGRIGEAFALLFLGLTGPFLVLFSPLVAYRVWRDGVRSRASIAFGMAALLAISVQSYFIVTFAPGSPPVQTALHWLMTSGPILFAGLFVGKTLPHLLLGENIAVTMQHWENTVPKTVLLLLGVSASIAALTAVILVLRGVWQLPKAQRALGLALIFCAAALFASVMRRGLSDPQPLGPFSGGSRYAYIPYLHLTWTFLLITQSPGMAANLGRFCLLLVGCSTLSTIGPPAPGTQDRQWAKYIRRYEQGETVDVPFPPDGLSGMSWRVRLVPPVPSR